VRVLGRWLRFTRALTPPPPHTHLEGELGHAVDQAVGAKIAVAKGFDALGEGSGEETDLARVRQLCDDLV
jgi:hypothetical protein